MNLVLTGDEFGAMMAAHDIRPWETRMATDVSRRTFLTRSVAAVAAAALAGAAIASPEGESAMSDALIDLLNESLASKRGVTVVVDGTTIALVVTAIDDTYLTGRSQQYERIVVKLSEISAAYM